jgi:hypothetical protein
LQDLLIISLMNGVQSLENIKIPLDWAICAQRVTFDLGSFLIAHVLRLCFHGKGCALILTEVFWAMHVHFGRYFPQTRLSMYVVPC